MFRGTTLLLKKGVNERLGITSFVVESSPKNLFELLFLEWIPLSDRGFPTISNRKPSDP